MLILPITCSYTARSDVVYQMYHPNDTGFLNVDITYTCSEIALARLLRDVLPSVSYSVVGSVTLFTASVSYCRLQCVLLKVAV